MRSSDYLHSDHFDAGVCRIVNGHSITFQTFRKAIKLNSELREKIRDIIDLHLCEYAFRNNSEIIQAAREKAEAESTELMMKFLREGGNYRNIAAKLHRNRVIKLLAQKDKAEQAELIKKYTYDNRSSFCGCI